MNPDDRVLEIPEELLTQVAGGMRKDQELVLRTLMRSAKMSGYSMEQAMKSFAAIGENTAQQEYMDYIAQNWDQF
jgi:hypothetical protein